MVNSIINPILAFYSGFCMDDSFIFFSSIIHELPPCVESQFMFSLDITTLFINVPREEVISICVDFLYCSPLTSVPSLLETVFVELMEFVTKSVSFSFNDTMYRKVDGISMGSPLGSFLLIFLLSFMRNYSLTGFIYVSLMITSYVLVHVMRPCHSSIV